MTLIRRILNLCSETTIDRCLRKHFIILLVFAKVAYSFPASGGSFSLWRWIDLSRLVGIWSTWRSSFLPVGFSQMCSWRVHTPGLLSPLLNEFQWNVMDRCSEGQRGTCLHLQQIWVMSWMWSSSSDFGYKSAMSSVLFLVESCAFWVCFWFIFYISTQRCFSIACEYLIVYRCRRVLCFFWHTWSHTCFVLFDYSAIVE